MDDQKLDVVALFKQAAFEVGGYNLENLTLDTQLSELSLDSVSVMETIGLFEQRLGIRFNDEDLSRLTNLRDLEALIQKAKQAA
jgi:acyl carrier protein